MSRIFVSGLVNTETTAKVRKFPIAYYPIDYPFFGVDTAVSGVAYNIACALNTLGDCVELASMTGSDFQSAYIRSELEKRNISARGVREKLSQTPGSVVLYDDSGRRQIYCDLKDIQETGYGFSDDQLDNVDLVVACNINFNRELLSIAKSAGKIIATDVHVLGSVYDEYNREFMEAADILFLSDEAAGEDPHHFLWELECRYNTPILVMGRGAKGALMYLRDEERFVELPAVTVGPVVNTVGAGDALFSAFLHYYAKGMDPVASLKRAQIFASAKIGTNGASRGFVNEMEIEDMYHRVYEGE